MEKTWVTICFMLLSLFPTVSGYAAVTGNCVNCHTMHNSQNGSAVVYSGAGASWTADGITGGNSNAPLDTLLVSDCVGCHSNTGSETIVTLGSTEIPIVYNHAEPTHPLAGGNFYWVQASGDGYGHNVAGISSTDAALDGKAPGTLSFNQGEGMLCTPCHFDLSISADTAWAWGTNKGGCEACHVPRHHANGTNSVVGQAEGWYRFLGSAMAPPRGSGLTNGDKCFLVMLGLRLGDRDRLLKSIDSLLP